MADARLGHRTCCRDYCVIPERERLFVSPPAKPPGVTPLIDPDPYRLQTDRIVEPGEIPRGYKLNARKRVPLRAPLTIAGFGRGGSYSRRGRPGELCKRLGDEVIRRRGEPASQRPRFSCGSL